MRVTSGDVASILLEGANEAARAIAATYGPRGRTVMLDRPGGLLTTKDGVAVAWEIEPADPRRRLGARAVQAASAALNTRCGDGTTTVAILVHALLAASVRQIAGGASPAKLARELQEAGRSLLDSGVLEFLHLPVDDEETMLHVARTASNHDEEVARAIVDLVVRLGIGGLVRVEEGHGRGVEIEYKSGLELDRGWESSDFANDGDSSREFPIALVAVVDGTLTRAEDVTTILEEATQFPHPLVLVSRGCFGDALKMLLTNDRKLERPIGGRFEAVAVRAPGREDKVRDCLDDLAALTGATVMDPAVMRLSSATSDAFGSAQTVVVRSGSTVFTAFPDKFPNIEARVAQLRREEGVATHSHDREMLRSRIARLSDGLGVLRVGGTSQTEIRERRGRIEDAFQAVRRAVEGGIVPGGGVAYVALAEALRQTSGGPAEAALCEALCSPLLALVGPRPALPPREVLRKIVERGRASETGLPSWGLGWDAGRGTFRDLRSPLLCDPLLVVREVVDVAVSTVSTLVNTGALLTRVGHST